MTWLPVEDTLPSHRKIRRLARLLKDAPQSIDAQAMGHVIASWLWSISSCNQEGGLPAEDGWLLEEAALWRGEEGGLVDAMRESGFLCRDGDRLVISGWDDHQKKILDEREYWRQKKKKQRERERAKESLGDTSGDTSGDTYGESCHRPDHTDHTDDLNQRNEPDQTEGFAGLATQEQQREKVEAALSSLSEASFWTPGALETRTLLTMLSIERPDIDLPYEVDTWIDYAHDNGPPDNCTAALKGWIANAYTGEMR